MLTVLSPQIVFVLSPALFKVCVLCVCCVCVRIYPSSVFFYGIEVAEVCAITSISSDWLYILSVSPARLIYHPLRFKKKKKEIYRHLLNNQNSYIEKKEEKLSAVFSSWLRLDFTLMMLLT